jgi:hypothetical protein
MHMPQGSNQPGDSCRFAMPCPSRICQYLLQVWHQRTMMRFNSPKTAAHADCIGRKYTGIIILALAMAVISPSTSDRTHRIGSSRRDQKDKQPEWFAGRKSVACLPRPSRIAVSGEARARSGREGCRSGGGCHVGSFSLSTSSRSLPVKCCCCDPPIQSRNRARQATNHIGVLVVLLQGAAGGRAAKPH